MPEVIAGFHLLAIDEQRVTVVAGDDRVGVLRGGVQFDPFAQVNRASRSFLSGAWLGPNPSAFESGSGLVEVGLQAGEVEFARGSRIPNTCQHAERVAKLFGGKPANHWTGKNVERGAWSGVK